eukprot:symbB.v1.2.017258.t1/scaffold1346.1/size178581/11
MSKVHAIVLKLERSCVLQQVVDRSRKEKIQHLLNDCYQVASAPKFLEMPNPFGEAESDANSVVGVINKRLYICGGLDESRQPLNSVEAFTPPGVSVQMPHCTPRERYASTAAAVSGSWQVMPAMAERRGWPAAVALQGLLYVCGGRDEQREPLSSVERLNNFPSIWLPLPSLSSQRAGASAAACGGRLYVCGGAFGAQMLNSVERFDPKVGTWETLPPMSARRAYVAAATIAGTIHVFGGSDGGQCLLSSERFDPTLNTWTPLPDMNERRSGAASVALMI